MPGDCALPGEAADVRRLVEILEMATLTGASAVWTDISNGLPPRSMTQIAVDPANDRTAYVAFSGFSGLSPVC